VNFEPSEEKLPLVQKVKYVVNKAKAGKGMGTRLLNKFVERYCARDGALNE